MLIDPLVDVGDLIQAETVMEVYFQTATYCPSGKTPTY